MINWLEKNARTFLFFALLVLDPRSNKSKNLFRASFLMLALKAGVEGQDPLTTVERAIADVKEEKRELKSNIAAFENDKSQKDDETSLTLMYSQLDSLEKRLAGLEDERRLLRAQTLAPPQAQGKWCNSLSFSNSTGTFLSSTSWCRVIRQNATRWNTRTFIMCELFSSVNSFRKKSYHLFLYCGIEL